MSYSETVTYEDLKRILETIPLSTITYGRGDVGEIKPFAGSAIPTGWLLCDGSAVSRTTYSELFTVIGTTYGTGDGSTTFNLPDLRNRFMVGAGDEYELNDKGGEKAHALTVDELAHHRHDMALYNSGYSQQSFSRDCITTNAWSDRWSLIGDYMDGVGRGQAHENRPPYIGINFIIYAKNTKTVASPQIDLFYPVGAYFETSDSTFDPNIKWGGTWVTIAQKEMKIMYKNNVTLSANADNIIAQVTLEPNTRYLILGSAGTGVATSMTSNTDIKLESGTTVSWYKGPTNAVSASSGSTLTTWGYIRTNSQCVVSVRKYNYTSSAITTGNGQIIAIPLNNIIDESKICWHRIA